MPNGIKKAAGAAFAEEGSAASRAGERGHSTIVYCGSRKRRSYGKFEEILEIPNLIEVVFGRRPKGDVPRHLAHSGFYW
jgi:hypothetical protein